MEDEDSFEKDVIIALLKKGGMPYTELLKNDVGFLKCVVECEKYLDDCDFCMGAYFHCSSLLMEYRELYKEMLL